MRNQFEKFRIFKFSSHLKFFWSRTLVSFTYCFCSPPTFPTQCNDERPAIILDLLNILPRNLWKKHFLMKHWHLWILRKPHCLHWLTSELQHGDIPSPGGSLFKLGKFLSIDTHVSVLHVHIMIPTLMIPFPTNVSNVIHAMIDLELGLSSENLLPGIGRENFYVTPGQSIKIIWMPNPERPWFEHVLTLSKVVFSGKFPLLCRVQATDIIWAGLLLRMPQSNDRTV